MMKKKLAFLLSVFLTLGTAGAWMKGLALDSASWADTTLVYTEPIVRGFLQIGSDTAVIRIR